MSIAEQANEILHSVFGYKSFRNQQLPIIESVIRGEDNVVIIPTGGGKSLCYQIPALILPGTTVVISPLIALMKDQVDQLLAYGIKAAYLNGSQSPQEQQFVANLYIQGEIKLLYIAPERLATSTFINMLKSVAPSLIAIDEAHCISQWGHDFRPEYLQIGQLKAKFSAVPIIALTATADDVTRKDIIERLNLDKPQVRLTSFDRPNIRYTVVERLNPLEQVSSFLTNQKGNSGIIYCSSRAKVDDMASRLANRGYSVAAYHAGLTTQERANAQERFLKDDVAIMVATVAFGMGINKPNVRFVIHANAPRTIEAYYQETGRAGRDGLPAEAILLNNERDFNWYQTVIAEKEEGFHKSVELHKLSEMIAFTQAQTCRRIVLLNYFGEHRVEKCNNCDVCLYPLEHYNGLVDAQKILSCVYRVGQNYGTQYLVDVLRGSNRSSIKENGHNTLSVYGIGKEHSADYWTSIIRQLIHLGYLKQDPTSFSALFLSEEARNVLRGDISLSLVKPRLELVKRTRQNRYARSINQTTILSYEERSLFNNLKRLRKEIADMDDVAPYIIFSDESLLEMVKTQPESKRELLGITGVGKIKLEKYGELFLDEIEKFITAN
ncbi:DNA helicase RecQ [Orbus wheelerorum]|uniref:DNA helicase RecQ n=1 Tax=Orbus wheelerorum TaxID=3074111 RepID=UPI00370D1B73